MGERNSPDSANLLQSEEQKKTIKKGKSNNQYIQG